jgi:hypothetical protein
MNHNGKTISRYEDLVAERRRLEQLIDNQKNIIRHDLDELKLEFKKEIKPAVEAAAFVKKIARPETRNETLFKIGTGLLLDIFLKRVFRNSSAVVQVILPKIIKNYSTHVIHALGNRAILLNGTPKPRSIQNRN